ncbi:UNKNOWN [Stylonychia lemnae]|uniref:START domain-containing protein n=1 Tax=Stylonychia lemnae TaxID=5949 RepID=A0A077ZZU2_STYLE|nr:UNKNOWN [Stylonychia lemnae]|eukprot:CDW75451.1 UNKNOWN [Stylonychia lemnae]
MGNILCCDSRDQILINPAQEERHGQNMRVRLKVDIHSDSQNLNQDGEVVAEFKKENESRESFKNERNSQKLDIDLAKSLIDDELKHFLIDLDDDHEFTELSELRNEFESDVVFTKKGLVEYINTMLQKEQAEDQKKAWEKKLDKENVLVYLKKGGSHLDKNLPYIFTPEHRMKWDKEVLKFDLTNPNESVPQIVLNYQLNKSPIGANKDFYDKQIKFLHNNEIYIYYSAIPKDTELKPSPAKVDRARTIVGLGKLYRRAEDDKIVYSMLMQTDLKIKITPALISMFLPKGFLEWSKKVNKYINDNYDTI